MDEEKDRGANNPMGIEIKATITCSMCGGMERYSKPHPLEIVINGAKDLDQQALKKQIEAQGWIVQLNGDSIDTYCTKKCAL
jgi:hypothetical protein